MKKRLTIYIFLIAALGIALSSLFGMWSLRYRELAASRMTLSELLNLMDAQSYHTNPEALADQFSAAAPDKRLTILSPQGEVLVDTVGEITEDHSDRPEFQEALDTGWGEDSRRSDTLGMSLLYEAKTFSDGNIGRVSMPISSVDALVLQALGGFLLAAAVALVLTLLLARRLADRTAVPLEQKEEALEQEGEKLQIVRSEFAANVSHELKTPLTSIKGFTDMLSSGMVQSSEDQKRFITLIGVEVDRLIELINDVLKISELESVAMPQSDDQAQVFAVAEEVQGFLNSMAEAAGVQLTFTGENATVSVAPARLRELLTNLLENGIKYNEPGGQVNLNVKRQEHRVVLSVTDNGIGIPKDCQERVFERFYRVDKGRTRKNGGTGLGLAIVKHIVMLYGGTISLKSELGGGTTVTVELKAVE